MLRSIVITGAVSGLIAYGLSEWVDFWKCFSLVTGIQFIAFWIINTRFQVDKDKLYAEFDENFEGILKEELYNNFLQIKDDKDPNVIHDV